MVKWWIFPTDVVSLLAAWCSVASAACGWVLWHETIMYMVAGTRTADWTLDSAYPTFVECDGQAQELAEAMATNIGAIMAFRATGKMLVSDGEGSPDSATFSDKTSVDQLLTRGTGVVTAGANAMKSIARDIRDAAARDFPSWTSPVRIRSPAPNFQGLAGHPAGPSQFQVTNQ